MGKCVGGCNAPFAIGDRSPLFGTAVFGLGVGRVLHDPNEIDAVWSALSSFDPAGYRIVSRSARPPPCACAARPRRVSVRALFSSGTFAGLDIGRDAFGLIDRPDGVS
jgi:hypothetical protein